MAGEFLNYGYGVIHAADEALATPASQTDAVPAGAGGRITVYGIPFEEDSEGNLLLAGKIIMETVRRAYEEHLKDEARDSEMEHVMEVMRFLDTAFYDNGQDFIFKGRTFVVPGDASKVRYTAEEVNYLGVGTGFRHFRVFGEDMATVRAMVEFWNLKEHGHLASPGEHYWAEAGFGLYQILGGVPNILF